jgi:hypothetical protein
MITIYALVCPRTEQIKYIGKTSDLGSRLSGHISEAIRSRKSHKQRWISKLLGDGLKPRIVSLEEVPEGVRWQDRERWWIAWAVALGLPLTNQTAGGEGLDFLDPEAEQKYREKRSVIGKRIYRMNPGYLKPANDACRESWAKDRDARIAACMAGWTPEAKENWRTTMAQVCSTPEFRAAHSEGIKAGWVTHRATFMAAFGRPETKAKHSARAKRCWSDPKTRGRMMNRWTPEARERQRVALMERREKMLSAMTPEVRQRQAESMRKNWAKRKAAQ